MKAAHLLAYGDVDQFKYEDAPMPEAGAGEVVVKVEASSVNPVDIYQRLGYLQKNMPLTFPVSLGMDVAGTISALGVGVSGFAVGDRVIAKLALRAPGAHQEYVAVSTDRVAKLAANVSFAAGATLPLAGLTGWQAVDALDIKAGDRVVVTGALGAVGRAAVQHLKSLGAIPVAAVRAERVEEAKAVTADAIAVDDASQRGKFSKGVSTVGGEVGGLAIDLIANSGTLSTVAGIPEGANADGRITIVPVMAEDRGPMLQAIADAAGRGELVIPVGHTVKLSEMAKAHQLQAGGRTGGKIILVP